MIGIMPKVVALWWLGAAYVCGSALFVEVGDPRFRAIGALGPALLVLAVRCWRSGVVRDGDDLVVRQVLRTRRVVAADVDTVQLVDVLGQDVLRLTAHNVGVIDVWSRGRFSDETRQQALRRLRHELGLGR